MNDINENEVLVYEEDRTIHPVANPLDSNPITFKAGLDRRKENRNTLMEWIRSALIEGRDYGSIIINGQKSKPSLLKPGAEKIAGMLGLIPKFPNLSEYEDSVLNGNKIDIIILKCELQSQAGEVVGEGVGARDVLKQDNGDLNKALKMASKSAMIDATLRCAGISEVFTQDIEEMHASQVLEHEPVIGRDSQREVELASDKQTNAVGRLLENPKVTIDEKRNIHRLIEDGLLRSKASEILDYFYGGSKFLNGEWVKISRGVLSER